MRLFPHVSFPEADYERPPVASRRLLFWQVWSFRLQALYPKNRSKRSSRIWGARFIRERIGHRNHLGFLHSEVAHIAVRHNIEGISDRKIARRFIHSSASSLAAS